MNFRRAYIEEPEMNLIPLIDVLLVVLIFLAVSTTYSRFSTGSLPSSNPATFIEVTFVLLTVALAAMVTANWNFGSG